jgi:hypothetical protein
MGEGRVVGALNRSFSCYHVGVQFGGWYSIYTGCLKKNETGFSVNISGPLRLCPEKIEDQKTYESPLIFHTETFLGDFIGLRSLNSKIENIVFHVDIAKFHLIKKRMQHVFFIISPSLVNLVKPTLIS